MSVSMWIYIAHKHETSNASSFVDAFGYILITLNRITGQSFTWKLSTLFRQSQATNDVNGLTRIHSRR